MLKEKRQAVISHAVTKGLDPNAPVRDSGIKWLGTVPAHWSVEALGNRYRVQLGKMLDSKKQTGVHSRPYLRVFDVQWGQINVDELPLMDFDKADRIKFLLEKGDLLVNEGGSYPGRSAVWEGQLEECYYQKALHRVRPVDKSRDTAYFLLLVMHWAMERGVFIAGGNETTIEHLPAEKLRRYRFPFPPLAEQEAIVRSTEAELYEIELVVNEVTRSIDLLQQRRTALISAAVTGKIDVRGFAKGQSA